MTDHLLSCDWGTSSFRLHLVETGSLKVAASFSSQEGNAAMNKKWAGQDGEGRVSFYLRYLNEALQSLAEKADRSLQGYPILISGMASSSIGMMEVPYAALPFSMQGEDVVARWLERRTCFDNRVLLISGVRSENDVMRGEETQMVGIAGRLTDDNDESTYILPGTHSKHIHVRQKKIIDFETYMTGEVFSVMSACSILSQSIDIPEGGHVKPDEPEAFRKGVGHSVRTHLLNGLFSARVNLINECLTKQQNYFYLSGLLIGAELGSLRTGRRRLVLCGGGSLAPFYRTAFDVLGLADRLFVITAEEVNKAALAGQARILNNIQSIFV